MDEEDKELDWIRKTLGKAIEDSKIRKAYVQEHIDDFRLPDLEYVENEYLPGMFWRIFAIPVDSDPLDKYEGEEHTPYVRLEWGWDAGMTQEKIDSMSEDSPSGKEWVYTTMDSIQDLRDQLTEILEKYDKPFGR